MLKLIVCLVAVASAVPQGPPAGPPPAAPEWFLREGLTGSFSERTAVCIEEANSTPQLPTLILIPENNKAEICINFPPRTLSDGRQLKGGWRHDIGKKGACANNCCSFDPPTKKANNIQHSEWFEGDCSSAPANKWTAPFLFQGQNGEVKSVCVDRDGKLEQVEGKLSNCGISNCCIMYENQ